MHNTIPNETYRLAAAVPPLRRVERERQSERWGYAVVLVLLLVAIALIVIRDWPTW